MGCAPSSTTLVEECDVLIVGAGFGGAYAAHLLTKQAPSLRVVVVEQSGRVGGRLHSADSDGVKDKKGAGEANKDELGGMRIFPSAGMEKVAELVNQTGLTLIPVPLGDGNNLFEYNTDTVKKGDAKSPTSGRSYNEINAAAYESYVAKHNADGSVDPYSCPVLREISVPTYLERFGMCDADEVKWWVAYSGYDLYPDEVQASIFVKDGKLYGSGLTDDQRYVKEGFMELVKRLLAMSGVESYCNTTVTNIIPADKSKDGTCMVTCETVGASSSAQGNADVDTNAPVLVPETALVKTTTTTTVYRAKRVLVSVAANQANAFNKGKGLPVSKQRQTMMKGSMSLPLFKCFLQWHDESVWWGKGAKMPTSGVETPFLHGKSTTNSRCRQVHYYDQEDLLIYNSNQHAEYWNNQFKLNPEEAAREVYSLVRDLHGPDEIIPEPDFTKTTHKYWPSGSHKWRLNVDVAAAVATIPDGKTDGSHVYVAGDAFSAFQGWVLGAVETVDAAIPLLLDGLSKV